jgi:fermentation-respiration switch protein FrsA (DUF1100 family)
MRITNITRWLLVTILLLGCSSTAKPQTNATSTEVVVVPVASATTIVTPTISQTQASQPADTPTAATVLNGGGATEDEPTLPLATVAAVMTATPSPTTKASATSTATITVSATATLAATETPTTTIWPTDPHLLQIEVMRQQSYPGSPITIEQTLEPGSNYNQYVVSYLSDGYKIYALMTVPTGTKPDAGWPVIVFNHGYITPAQYRTTERYVAYVDTIARNGYIVFKSDYRGHGSSEGEEVSGGGYGTPAYTVDVLNAVASLQAYADADPNRIGMWGHSMGGQLTLRAMVVTEDIKAGVIWGGVVPPYPDIIETWDFIRNPDSFPWMSTLSLATPQSPRDFWLQDFSTWVEAFTTKYGNLDENPAFWATISPNTYLEDLSGPIQLHHSTTDEMVPVEWAETLAQELEDVDQQPYELYTYPGDNHNISANFGVAMQRTVAFFDQYVKGQQ